MKEIDKNGCNILIMTFTFNFAEGRSKGGEGVTSLF